MDSHQLFNLAQKGLLADVPQFALRCTFNLIQGVDKRYAIDAILKKWATNDELAGRLSTSTADRTCAVIAFGGDIYESLDALHPCGLRPFSEKGEAPHVALATGGDILLDITGSHSSNFEVLRQWFNGLEDFLVCTDETHCFKHLDSRDLTGFVDGTANPIETARLNSTVIEEGALAGGSYVLSQRYEHDLSDWHTLSESQQEEIIGRTKVDSIELSPLPHKSHVERVDTGQLIYRKSLPYGSVTGTHGLYFIAYSNELQRFEDLLDRMFDSGQDNDNLLKFTKAVTGAYFFAPPVAMLATLADS